jgi:hypothetical protein
MTDDIIKFEVAKDRRTQAEIDADQARWDDVWFQLTGVMTKSKISHTALTSATLRALVDVLEEGCDISRKEAKSRIARSLAAFQE